MQGGSDQTFNTPATRALGNSHWCKTCNSSEGALSKSKHALNISGMYLDSTIALSWIKADHPARWHTFVSNRVSQIQSMLPTTEFIHVPSEENPANLVAQQTFWFQGPSRLGSSFPDQPQTLLTKEEARQEVKTLTVLTSPSNSLVDLNNFNSLVKLLRTLCICKVAFKKRSQGDLWSEGNGSRLTCGGQSRSNCAL